jgi:hypothetical protein
MTELLNDISRNPGASILVAIVGLILVKVALDLISNFLTFLHHSLCAFTGKYPPARPIVQCNCETVPCACCEDGNGCDNEDCDCYVDTATAE